DEFITGARLLNAIGRAGRAGKESEGWIVLARNAAYDRNDFRRLTPTEADMPVISALTTASALEELARLETAARDAADIALIRAGPLVESFIGHIWLLASIAEESGDEPRSAIDGFLESCLAWQQLADPDKMRWRRVSRQSLEAYARRPPNVRRRWSRTGVSLPSTAVLDDVATDIARSWPVVAGTTTQAALDQLLTDGRLERLLSLPEAQLPVLRSARSGRYTTIEINALGLLTRWVGGDSVGDLASTFLAEVRDAEFRQELLGDFISAAFDNFLPWALGIIIDWSNQLLTTDRAGIGLIPVNLPAHIRYGVSSDLAVQLIRAGVPSRAVASQVASSYQAAGNDADLSLREWLCTSSLGEWAQRYAASPQDLRALLEFTRLRGARLAARVLNAEEVVVPIADYNEPPNLARSVELRELTEEVEPARLGFFSGDVQVGVVRPEHLAELGAIRATGAPIHVELDANTDPPSARISLAAIDT
ncbi:MAG: hypothetical protein K5799_14780, partial [Erythrobacter sp.]|nr:hypothetical protein [Erythrobacter sp.]